jgi:hypothetical protein
MDGWAINPLNAEFNPICHLLSLLGAQPILHVNRIKVKGSSASKTASSYKEYNNRCIFLSFFIFAEANVDVRWFSFAGYCTVRSVSKGYKIISDDLEGS